MDQIATFHTHFGALTFQRKRKAEGTKAVMMPVPRALSASCGTCVKFTGTFELSMADEDLDSVYAVQPDKSSQLIFRNAEK